MDMQHGHGHAAWKCSMGLQHIQGQWYEHWHGHRYGRGDGPWHGPTLQYYWTGKKCCLHTLVSQLKVKTNKLAPCNKFSCCGRSIFHKVICSLQVFLLKPVIKFIDDFPLNDNINISSQTEKKELETGTKLTNFGFCWTILLSATIRGSEDKRSRNSLCST